MFKLNKKKTHKAFFFYASNGITDNKYSLNEHVRANEVKTTLI